MALTQHTIDLINADIDGEISAGEKRELEAILATNIEANAHYSDLVALCKCLDAVDDVSPPGYLHHSIMQMTASMRPGWKPSVPSWRFFSAPTLRFAGALAAGIVIGIGVLNFVRMPATEFDDLAGLVGTMSDVTADLADQDIVYISHDNISGSATLHRSGQLLIVDLDLISHVPVDIVAEFPREGVWFNGFAQLESSGTSVAAEPGRVTVRAEGKRRYAVYLHDADGTQTTVDLRFVAGGVLIHQAQLVSDESIE